MILKILNRNNRKVAIVLWKLFVKD